MARLGTIPILQIDRCNNFINLVLSDQVSMLNLLLEENNRRWIGTDVNDLTSWLQAESNILVVCSLENVDDEGCHVLALVLRSPYGSRPDDCQGWSERDVV